jgi:hypothetical protein
MGTSSHPKSSPCLVPGSSSRQHLSSSAPRPRAGRLRMKHDGWRALHRHDAGAVILSKCGKDILGRFAVIGAALHSLPPCVIDAEIVG